MNWWRRFARIGASLEPRPQPQLQDPLRMVFQEPCMGDLLEGLGGYLGVKLPINVDRAVTYSAYVVGH